MCDTSWIDGPKKYRMVIRWEMKTIPHFGTVYVPVLKKVPDFGIWNTK